MSAVHFHLQAGFQANGCVHELWRHTVDEYITFLVDHNFNAVRLPLSAAIVAAPSWQIAGDFICGAEYEGWESLDVLDDVVRRLQAAGIFVGLDVHTLTSPEHNQALWCISDGGGCDAEREALIFSAWEKLAHRYCSCPNVIFADLFNEPYYGTWKGELGGSDWGDFAKRMGNVVLGICPRWLIVVEGVGSNDGQCGALGHGGCWWGENITPAREHPVQLALPNRLVLSPHVCTPPAENPDGRLAMFMLML